MNATELNEWVEYHNHLFDGFRGWWRKRHQDAVDVWSDAMSSISLESAKQASQDLVIGDVEHSGGYGSHLKAIRARSRDLELAGPYETTERTWNAGSQVFNCGSCLDSGLVTIWHPSTVADAIDGKLIKPAVCGVPCSCRIGARHLAGGWNGSKRHKPTTVVYSEGQHCEYLDSKSKRMRRSVISRATGDSETERIKAISTVAEGYHQSKRTTEFDDWNNSD